MTCRSIGSWSLAWYLFRKSRQYEVIILRLPQTVCHELEQYLDFACILCIRACCRGAVPEEGLLGTLQEDIVRHIQHAEFSSRTAALDALIKLEEKYNWFVIRHLPYQEEPLQYLRNIDSFEELPAMALKGNPAVIEALLEVLPGVDEEKTDWDPIPFTVRALDALKVISDKGNASVISAIVARTQHGHVWVRATAVSVLQCVATVGDKSAIRAILGCVSDEGDDGISGDEYEIRKTSLETLKVIVEATNNSRVVDAVTERIEIDTSEKVRVAALDVLPHVARKGNVVAIMACVDCLKDGSDEIRKAAWEAIAHLAKKGNEAVISACLGSLEDGSAEIACAAAELLSEVVPKGHAAAVGCLAAALHSRSRGKDFDQAIVQALSRAVTRGNRTAICAMMQFIATSALREEQTRTKTIKCYEWKDTFEALRNMAAKDDVIVISFISSYLGSNVSGVREQAAYSLSCMLEGSSIDSSWAWLAAARDELRGLRRRRMEPGELTHEILREMMQSQGWLLLRRLRKKSRIVSRYV